MKYVWLCQDNNDMRVLEVFTTKKAVVAETKETYGKGRFHTIDAGRIYSYFLPDDKYEPVCSIEKVPVIHNKRNGLYRPK